MDGFDRDSSDITLTANNWQVIEIHSKSKCAAFYQHKERNKSKMEESSSGE